MHHIPHKPAALVMSLHTLAKSINVTLKISHMVKGQHNTRIYMYVYMAHY